MKRFAIGVDFGTLSGRAVLIDIDNGEAIADSVLEYSHKVMDKKLPCGTPLGDDWALQHPQDYLDVLEYTLPDVLKKSGIKKEQVIGLGIDFTSCTVLPVDEKGEPLCFKDNYKNNPHSYVKLWKHHAAQYEAEKINVLASERNEKFLKRYGGKISSEWLIPKIMQVLDEDHDLFEKTHRFIEAGDWIVMKLTDTEARSSCMAGYKAMWHKREGYPSKDFLKALDKRLENLVEDKLNSTICPIGSKAGEISDEGEKLTGLVKGTAVAVANLDAHVSVPATGITEPGKMLMIMGTSTCHLTLSKEEILVPGISGVVEDGIIPNYYAYEAGQACMGDHFEWFAENLFPYEYEQDAQKKGIKKLRYLEDKASFLKPGESGLIALDWWNGNRSVLVDADLTGIILGCTLQTKAEEIFRALVEATAFGTKMIIDTFKEYGFIIDRLIAAGGIAVKSPFVMQIYADVLDTDITVSKTSQIPALGSAMFGAVAAGAACGGYDDITHAAEKMAGKDVCLYKPIKEHVQIYKNLFSEYKTLHDYFGKGGNNIMKNLKRIKKACEK